jgi:hypothetical protein
LRTFMLQTAFRLSHFRNKLIRYRNNLVDQADCLFEIVVRRGK